jgi:hypothetical protein
MKNPPENPFKVQDSREESYRTVINGEPQGFER